MAVTTRRLTHGEERETPSIEWMPRVGHRDFRQGVVYWVLEGGIEIANRSTASGTRRC